MFRCLSAIHDNVWLRCLKRWGVSYVMGALEKRNSFTVCSLAFDYEPVWSNQLASHHSQASKALGKDIALDITIVVLGCPYESSGRFDDLRYHIIDKAMLVVDSCVCECLLIGPRYETVE